MPWSGYIDNLTAQGVPHCAIHGLSGEVWATSTGKENASCCTLRARATPFPENSCQGYHMKFHCGLT